MLVNHQLSQYTGRCKHSLAIFATSNVANHTCSYAPGSLKYFHRKLGPKSNMNRLRASLIANWGVNWASIYWLVTNTVMFTATYTGNLFTGLSIGFLRLIVNPQLRPSTHILTDFPFIVVARSRANFLRVKFIQ